MFRCFSIASKRVSIPCEVVPRELLLGSATGAKPSVGIEFAVQLPEAQLPEAQLPLEQAEPQGEQPQPL